MNNQSENNFDNQSAKSAKMILIKILNFLLLIKLSTSVIVNCEFKNVNETFGEFYACVTQGLETNEFENYMTGIKGTHLDGRSNDDVKFFFILDQEVEYFPSGLDKFFKNLVAISVKNCGLKYLFKSDFSGLSNLTHVAFGGNKIEFLGPKLFEGNPNLDELHFENNKITKISEDLFYALEKSPRIAHFNGNGCIDFDLTFPDPSLGDYKDMFVTRCPMTTADLIEITEKQFVKLSRRIESLEAPKTPEADADVTSDEEQVINISDELEALKSDDKYLRINISLTIQELSEKENVISSLNEQLSSYKSKIEKLFENLTETLEVSQAVKADLSDLDNSYEKLTVELKAAETKAETMVWAQSIIFEKLRNLELKSSSFEGRCNVTLQAKDSELDSFKMKLVEHKKLAIKNSQEIKNLATSNKKLNKKLTTQLANAAFCENLQETFEKSKRSIAGKKL